MLKILYGSEPYLIDFYKNRFLSDIQFPEMNLNTYHGWDDRIPEYLATYPVMDNKKAVVLYIDSLKELDNAGFKNIHGSLSDSQLLLVIAKDLDKRTAIYKTLSKEKGVLLACDKLTDAVLLKKAVYKEVDRLGAVLPEDAYQVFMDRENYTERDDINLLNVFADLQRLSSYDQNITVDTVNLLIKPNIQENTFGICKMIRNGNIDALKAQAEVMRGNEIGVLSALLKEYRVAFKSKFYSQKDIGVKYISLSSLAIEELTGSMSFILSVIDGIKDGSIPEEYALQYVFMRLVKIHKTAA